MQPRIADTSTSAGNLRATPFAELLIELLERGDTGTLYVQGRAHEPLAPIRFEEGFPVRTRIAGAGDSLLAALVPLCARVEGAYAFAAGEDGIAPGPGVVSGLVDPFTLIAAAARVRPREDAIDALVAQIGRNLVRLNPRVDLDRYGFTRNERRLVEGLAEAPLELAEIAARSGAPEPIVQRLVYVLHVTRALTVLPAARRTLSGTVEHVQPPPARPAVPPPAGAGRYSLVEPEHGRTAVSDEDPDEPILVEIEEVTSSGPAPRSLAAQARAHQDRAEALLRQRRHREALREARQAIKLGGGNAQCLALCAWALHHVSGNGDRVHPRVWEHLDSALRRDPLCERAHLYKAQLLKRAGRDDDAHFHFQRVLQIEPDNLEAAREVRLHEMRRRHAQPSGLVQRLFHRRK